jgi:hypothetical protein
MWPKKQPSPMRWAAGSKAKSDSEARSEEKIPTVNLKGEKGRYDMV